MEISAGVLYVMLAAFSAFLMVAAVNFIMLVRNANGAAVIVKGIIEKNRESIDSTLASLPDVLKNVNDVAISAKVGMGKIGAASGSLDGALAGTALAISEGADGLIALIALANNLVKTVVRVVSSGKK